MRRVAGPVPRWLVLVLLSAVVACGGAETAGEQEAPTDQAPAATPAEGDDAAAQGDGEAVTIAASLPLTGMFQIPGTRHRQGYELCVDVLNERGGLLDRPVELIVQDNQSDTEVVVTQYQRFINVDRADLLLGTFSTLLAFPSSTVAEQAQMVYPEPSDSSLMSHSRGYEYIFGFTVKPVDFIGQTPVDALVHYRDAGIIPEEDFPETAAVLYQDDFFPNAIARGLLGGQLEIPGTGEVVDFSPGYLAETGIELVHSEQFPVEFNDWLGLANNAKVSGAEFLFVLTTPPAEAEIVRALETVGYNPKVTFFSQGAYTDFVENLGERVNGIMVWSNWDPTVEWEGSLAGEPFTNQDFVEAFRTAYDAEPDEDVSQAFAVCQAMAQAVEETGTLDNTVIRDWLDARTEDDPVRTIQGEYYFDDEGLTAGRDVLLLQWQDQELDFVFPTGEAYPDVVDLQWPKPPW